MVSVRSIVTLAAAAVIGLAAIVVLNNAPANAPRLALAGPCTLGPHLFFEDDSLFADPLEYTYYAADPGDHDETEMVITVQPGDKTVTIEIVGVPGNANIFNSFTPASGEGTFSTTWLTSIPEFVADGTYEYEIRLTCHGEVTKIPFDVIVGGCSAPDDRQPSGISGQSPPGCGGFGPTAGPSPAPTVAPTPTATAAPTPTSPPGQQLIWADNNCSTTVDPVDSLFILRGDAGLPTNTGDCPDMGAAINVLNASQHFWGDIDCTAAMTPVDSLKTLRYDAGLSASQEDGCPAINSPVTIVDF